VLLELDRWDVAEALVQPGVVEPADVLDDRQQMSITKLRNTGEPGSGH